MRNFYMNYLTHSVDLVGDVGRLILSKNEDSERFDHIPSDALADMYGFEIPAPEYELILDEIEVMLKKEYLVPLEELRDLYIRVKDYISQDYVYQSQYHGLYYDGFSNQSLEKQNQCIKLSKKLPGESLQYVYNRIREEYNSGRIIF